MQMGVTIKVFFQLPYRATEGPIKSLMRLCYLDLPVADHTHMVRRAGELSMKNPRRLRKGPKHVVVNSTSVEIFGEAELAESGAREASLRTAGADRLCKADRERVRPNGVGKRCTRRKVHLAVDETSKDMIGIEVTPAAGGKSEILPVVAVDGKRVHLSAAGGYNSHGCDAAVAERDAATILPCDGAVTCGDEHPRDAILQEIEAKRLDGWKNDSGYNRGSIAENVRYRFQQLGDSLYSRTFDRQVN